MSKKEITLCDVCGTELTLESGITIQGAYRATRSKSSVCTNGLVAEMEEKDFCGYVCFVSAVYVFNTQVQEMMK